MPIRIADSLPARAILDSENIFVMTTCQASRQDIRPLKLLILNLMPTKVTTETQLLRCLSNTPIQIEIDLMQTSSYRAKNTAEDHLLAFYTTFSEVRHNRYDGMIITGAPVETMDFEDVAYWQELREIMDWSTDHVQSTFHICWGAQAGLYHHYGVPKYALPQKAFGIFEHKLCAQNVPLLRGFDDVFLAPHSRHTETRAQDCAGVEDLMVLATSEAAGLYLAMSQDGRRIFVMGHAEYDAETLATEYFRDVSRGLPTEVPYHYFPENDPGQPPKQTWRSHAHLLYTNWLNYYVYQATPYDIDAVGTLNI